MFYWEGYRNRTYRVTWDTHELLDREVIFMWMTSLSTSLNSFFYSSVKSRWFLSWLVVGSTQNADFSTVCLFTVTHDHTAKQQSLRLGSEVAEGSNCRHGLGQKKHQKQVQNPVWTLTQPGIPAQTGAEAKYQGTHRRWRKMFICWRANFTN